MAIGARQQATVEHLKRIWQIVETVSMLPDAHIASLQRELKMDLCLTETQEMFKKVAADFVKAEVPAHQMTQWYKNKQTFQPQLIKKAAELGWLGMMLPEEYGGSGVSMMDCAVVFEELGHGPVPGTAFHFRHAQRAADFRSLHRRAKKILAAAALQRLIDRRSRAHR